MKFTFHVLLNKSESPVVLLSIEFNFVELYFVKLNYLLISTWLGYFFLSKLHCLELQGNKFSDIKPRLATLLKKETLVLVFFCKFCEIFKNIFFTEHLWVTASTHSELS